MPGNRTLVLRARPAGRLSADDFEIVDADMPVIREGEVLVRNLFASLDPGTRKLFGEADGYIEPIPVGGAVGCLVLGEVIETEDDRFPAGSLMVGTGALQTYSAITPAAMTWAVDRDLSSSLSHHLSGLGSSGFTAYFGLLEVGQAKPGDTVLVSAAAGAVGSLVGQIAKIRGCTVIGVAGGEAKCRRLVEEFGFDAAVDYHGLDARALAAAIREKAPQGIDLFFDNVGGAQFDAALDVMNWQGRVVACGTISDYDGGGGAVLHNLFRVVGKTLTIRGFLVFTFADRFQDALGDLAAWSREGRLRFAEDIEEGLDNAVAGFLKLFSGGNRGKAMVRIGPE